MEDYQPYPPVENKSNEKKIAAVLLASIVIIASVFVVAFDPFNLFNPPSETNNNDNNGGESVYTTEYTSSAVGEAYNFFNTTTHNFTIVDVRDCKCRYNSGHISDTINDPPAFEAIHNTNYESFYNTTDDLFIYDDDGHTESVEFCEMLRNNTYGEIMLLSGGYSAWVAAGGPHT